MAEDRLRATQQFYNRWAVLYDSLATAPGVTSWRERATETLTLSSGDTVLELGCGTGANFPFLREAVGPSGTVIGVDVAPGMLQQAQRRIDRRGWTNVHLVRGDATDPPIGAVDGLLTTFLVGMLGDPGAAVDSWLEQVRPGGQITLMNAERSNRPLVRPLNLAFRLFVRLTAPGFRGESRSPTRELERRWEEATKALFDGTVKHQEERLGAGFVVLASGTVPSESTPH